VSETRTATVGDPTEEVRRCRGCGEAAVLSGMAWRHTHFGMDSGVVTRDFRCQACGRSFKIRPRARLMGLFIAGVLLIPTCVGVPFLGLAWYRWKQDDWNPVVPGAPVPTRRYPVGPPPRRCAECGAIATATKVTQNRVNGLPVGIEVEYQCRSCGADFTIESVGGQVMNVLSGLTVGGIGAAFLFGADTPGWKYGGAAVCTLLALLMFGLVGVRLLARIRNPAMTGPM
jgi:hypothetical protein